MKKSIVFIPIIIGLIIFFAFVDRKVFGCYDIVQTVQRDSFTTQMKSLVSVPEMNPLPEVKPAIEMSPVAANKPSETKSATVVNPEQDIKPAEMKPQTETKSEKQLSPATVPIVTHEEAIKLPEVQRAYALAEKEKREPFYKFYQDTQLETVCFQGTIRAVSTIPDPEKNDYDNCLYALFVEIDSLLSEVTKDQEIASEAIVNVPIMKNKAILQDNIFLPGDKIWCMCSEYDTMPQSIQEIQLSDDIQSYEHQQLFPLVIRKIAFFQKDGNQSFAKRKITILPIQTLPKDEKAISLRREHIQNEIIRIEEEIKKHGGSFEKWKEEYKTVIEKYNALSDGKYRGWINNSFFAAGKGRHAVVFNTSQYISGILPYKKYLEEHNIDLIILRVPQKWEFAQCVLASDVFQDDPTWTEHYYECLRNDIEIIDPMPAMWEHRFDFPLFYFYNDYYEVHPFEGQAFISAMELSRVLKRYSYPSSDSPLKIEDYVFKTSDERYFWPEGNDKYNPEENLSFKRVIHNGESLGSLSVNSGSPFLFLSNSFFWYPQRTEGASLPAYTAFFLQHIPDWFYQDAAGTELIRTLITKREALSNRYAVIMVGHPAFWNSSFPEIPKYILELKDVTSITLEKHLNMIDDELIVSGKDLYTFTKLEDGSVEFEHKSDIIVLLARYYGYLLGALLALALGVLFIVLRKTVRTFRFPFSKRGVLIGMVTASISCAVVIIYVFSKYFVSRANDGRIIFLGPEQFYQKVLDKNGLLISDRVFKIKMSIPPVEGKRTCMVRFCFSEFSYLTIEALSDTNEAIDTFTLAPFDAKYQDVDASADLFVPVSDSCKNVSFRFSTKPFSKKMILKDIEIWYY